MPVRQQLRGLRIAFGVLLLLVMPLYAADVAKVPAAEKPAAGRSVSLIPMPAEMVVGAGAFPASGLTGITMEGAGDAAAVAAAKRVAGMLADHLAAECGVRAVMQGGKAAVRLQLVDEAALGDEGYRLVVEASGVRIAAAKPAGLFYGIQTLKQLLAGEGGKRVPFVTIQDVPRYAWRGMHLDVSRHFFTKAEVKKYLDHLAAYKLNTFHWHLVDGPGWRLEIKKYPRLTEIGAWRVDKRAQPWDWPNTEIGGGKTSGAYGGYYTQDDVREIVRYAEERFVTIVPEIEMPGHSYAALVAYPELACENNRVLKDGLHGKDVFCAANEKTYQMLEDVLDEVTALFPGKVIHVGGDEVGPEAWSQCGKCRRLAAELAASAKTPGGAAGMHAVQAQFMARIGKHLAAKGRRMMAWDEVLSGALPADASVSVWHSGAEVARQATARGIGVVLCPGSHCYFDVRQGKDAAGEPPAIGDGCLLLEQVYALEPDAGIPEAQRKFVLGVQGNVWTEYIQTFDHVEYMVFPRMCALAEVAWSPATRRHFAEFKPRVIGQEAGWKKRGIRFRPTTPCAEGVGRTLSFFPAEISL